MDEHNDNVLGERAIGRRVRFDVEGVPHVGTVTAYKAGSHYTVDIDGADFWVGVDDPSARLARPSD